jgi:hypothetical protein
MKHVPSFQRFINEKEQIDHQDFLEEFAKFFPKFGLSGTMSYDSPTPAITLDSNQGADLQSWIKKSKMMNKKEAVEWYLSEIDDLFFGEEDEIARSTKMMTFYEVIDKATVEKYSKLAKQGGLKITRFLFIDGPYYATIVVKFKEDADIQHAMRGRLSGKKYGI